MCPRTKPSRRHVTIDKSEHASTDGWTTYTDRQPPPRQPDDQDSSLTAGNVTLLLERVNERQRRDLGRVDRFRALGKRATSSDPTVDEVSHRVDGLIEFFGRSAAACRHVEPEEPGCEHVGSLVDVGW